MPSATSERTKMNGNKRKAAPVKEVHEKSKKIKTASVQKPSFKSAATAKKAVQSKPVEEPSDSSDSDSDGGVSLSNEEDEVIPNVEDGVHPERAKAVAVNSQSSREAHAKQKQLAQERKAAKPLAESLARTKKIWERLRRKSHVPVDERKALVTELFEIITGRIKDFVLKHDSVRVVQTAIKYANPEQKRMIAKELAGTYRQLAESRYAKFLIGKLLVQGDDEIRDIIVPEFFGHVRRLIKHPEASWILDDVYRGVASRQQKATILREWYGAEYALFQKDNPKDVSSELSDILAADTGKRAPIMRYLQELINHLLQKKTNGFTLLHDAMLQYFLNAKPGTQEVTEFIELLKGDEEGDLMKNLAFTKSGSRVVCLALALGTAKDRKHILKTFKDTLQLMASDPNGHIVILTAYEVIDDTVLTAKSIFPELLSKDSEKQVENVVNAANDIYARTTLLYLYQGRSKALFPASLDSDLQILAEIDQARTTTSKKDPEIRWTELSKALSPYLIKAIEAAGAELAASSFGCQFLTEVLFAAEGDKTAALETVASAAAGGPISAEAITAEDGTASTVVPHLSNTPYGGKMLKALVAGGRYDSKSKEVVLVQPPLNFASILYPHIKGHIIEWATGSSSFVILALLESDFSEVGELKAVLKKNKKKLEQAATEETAEQKSRRLELEASKDVKKGKKKPAKPVELGNRGSALLLQNLA